MNTEHTTFVLFGATGDLVSRKVLPALFELEIEKTPVADFIVPFTRRDLTTEEFLSQFVRPALLKVFPDLDEEAYERFSSRFEYVRGEYSERACFANLAKVLATKNMYSPKNELFYLPVHPEQLRDVVRYMYEEKVVEEPRNDPRGWERIVVEKPFGKSLESAGELFGGLLTIFDEDEIYCLDHYLGKPMLQSLRTIRAKNQALDEIVSNGTLSEIHVRLFESGGVEERGAFYDEVGAFLDVGESHVLEMFALTCSMLAGSANEILPREEALKRLKILSDEEVKEHTLRAQYEGYKNIRNVKKNSNTETYFRIESHILNEGEEGPPVVLEGGKGVGKEDNKEIEVLFTSKNEATQRVIFRLEPVEEVRIETRNEDGEYTEKVFPVRDRVNIKQYSEEYKTLFRSAISSERDENLFLSHSEVLALWKFTDPIISGWREGLVPLATYSKNTIPKVH